jgi:hypothetical protein
MMPTVTNGLGCYLRSQLIFFTAQRLLQKRYVSYFLLVVLNCIKVCHINKVLLHRSYDKSKHTTFLGKQKSTCYGTQSWSSVKILRAKCMNWIHDCMIIRIYRNTSLQHIILICIDVSEKITTLIDFGVFVASSPE